MSWQPRDTRIDNGNSTFPGPVSPEEQGRRAYAQHRYDPDTCRCTCGDLDHPEWGVTA